MLNFVKTLSTKITDGKRFIKFLRYGKDDVQTSVEAGAFGVDSNPVKDLIAVYAPTGEKGQTVIIGYLNKNQLADVGEFRMYSTDPNGVEKAYIWLKNDETIEIGGDDDHMVRYSALETAFNQLKSDFDSLVTTFNTHVHPGVTTGPGSTTVTATPSSPSSADITGAKIDDIKTR